MGCNGRIPFLCCCKVFKLCNDEPEEADVARDLERYIDSRFHLTRLGITHMAHAQLSRKGESRYEKECATTVFMLAYNDDSAIFAILCGLFM